MSLLVLRAGPFSARLSGRSVLVGALAWGLALAVGLISLAAGDFPLPLADVVETLRGGGTLISYDVVVRNRAPRVLVALLVGAALALSGAILQRLARNPLVSPDIVGINAGASAGAVVMIVVVGAGVAGVPAGALVGAALAAVLVQVLSGNDGHRLVLVGIGVTALLSSAATFLLSRSDRNEAIRAAIWLVGSVSGRTWEHVQVVGAAVLVLGPVALLATRQLRVLELGDDVARTLASGRGRSVLLVAAVGLAALATAVAGPVAFVALVAPQIVRRLLPGGVVGLLTTAGVGALIVVAADLAARRVLSPYELPVGVVTALVGAPVLIALLVRANRIGAVG